MQDLKQSAGNLSAILGLVSLICLLLLPACPTNESVEQTTSNAVQEQGSSTAPPQPTIGPEDEVPTQLTLLCQGDYQGFLRPCQCSQKQSGGWPRTGSLVSALSAVLTGNELPPGIPDLIAPSEDFVPAINSLLDANEAADTTSATFEEPQHWPPALVTTPQPLACIDLGNFSRMLTAYPVQRTQYELKLMAEAGFAACVPGSAELEFTQEQANEAFAECPLPLVSCNLDPGTVSLPLVPAIALAPGWYLIGVTSNLPSFPTTPDNTWFALKDAVQSAKATRGELPSDATVIVAALHQPREVIEALAKLDVELVIGYDANQQPDWPSGLAPVFNLPAVKGMIQELLTIDTTQPEPQIAEWRIELNEAWPDDPAMLELISTENEVSRQMLADGVSTSGQEDGWKDTEWTTTDKFLPTELRHSAPATATYLGADACIGCHQSAYDTWMASRHSHAMQSLVDLGESQTLDCLVCHTTGMYKPSGFDALQPVAALTSVSCEECHGPGSQHVEAVSSGTTTELMIERFDLVSCIRCHDPYNSPKFEQHHYWELIAH